MMHGNVFQCQQVIYTSAGCILPDQSIYILKEPKCVETDASELKLKYFDGISYTEHSSIILCQYIRDWNYFENETILSNQINLNKV